MITVLKQKKNVNETRKGCPRTDPSPDLNPDHLKPAPLGSEGGPLKLFLYCNTICIILFVFMVISNSNRFNYNVW